MYVLGYELTTRDPMPFNNYNFHFISYKRTEKKEKKESCVEKKKEKKGKKEKTKRLSN